MVKHSRKKSRKAHRKSNKMKGGINRTLEIDDLNERKPRDLDTLDLSVISNSDDDDHDFGLNDSLNLDNTNMRDSMDTINESMTNIGDDYDYNNDSNNMTMDSLHLSDLNEDENESSLGNTTIEDDSIGGKKRRRTMKKRKMMKKRKTMKKIRTTKKRKQTKKQKGGMCYGNGVGANSYDPNFSIYNTRELELFPYKPK
jgi:hypothetical protein